MMAAVQTSRSPRKQSQSGQTTVEFALVSLLLITLSLFVVEAGRFGASYIMVASAAREGAHAGSFASVTTDAPLIAAANQAVPLLGTLPASAVSISPAGTDSSPAGPGRTPGGTITVTVTYTYSTLDMFSYIFGTTFSMTATSSMPVD